MQVTYLYHSGFLVEYDQCYLLFDYVQGTLPVLRPEKKVYVFVSHRHHDHFSEAIFHLQIPNDVQYILSDDCKSLNHTVMYVQPGQHYVIDQMQIQTLCSTDEGVAFVIALENSSLFYAGDFHWWDWGKEDSAIERKQMELQYRQQLQTLCGKLFDVALLVMDPRLEERFAKGALTFFEYADTQHLFCMHMWDTYAIQDAFLEIADKEMAKKVHKITYPNQTFRI